MLLLYLIVLIGVLMYSLYIKNNFFNPLVLFAMCWCIFPILANMGIYGIYKLSMDTNICIIVSIIVFCFLYILLSSTNQINSLKIQTKDVNNYLNVKFLVVGNILSWFFLLPYTIKAIMISKALGFEFLREFSTTQLIESTKIQILYNWFLVPLYLATIVFVCIIFIDGKIKNNFCLLIVSLISIFLHAITFAARALLVKYLFYFIFAILFCNMNKNKIKNKKIFMLFGVISLILSAIILLTNLRTNSNFFESVAVYYVGPFSLFDYYMMHPDMSNLMTVPYMYGTASLGFIYNILESIKYVVMGSNYLGSDNIITQITAEAFPIAPNIYINAATTSMYPFMRDFGLIGLIIGFTFMALLIYWVEYKTTVKPTYRNKALYISVLYVIFKLSMSYEMLTPSFTFMIIYIYIVTTKIKIFS